MRLLFSALLFLCGLSAASALEVKQTFTVDEDITLVQITDNVYVHVSIADFGRYGRVSCNGMVIVCDDKALMIDTPADDLQKEALVRFVENSLGAKTTILIASHWHDDCIGGIDYIHEYGASSLGLQMTIDLAKEHNITPPQNGFS